MKSAAGPRPGFEKQSRSSRIHWEEGALQAMV
jgi:hypothetical protein